MEKCWFLVTEGIGEDRMYDLFYAESKSDVKKRLSPLGSNSRITKMTERGMLELVGCKIMTGKDDDAAVEHPLLFYHNSRTVWING